VLLKKSVTIILLKQLTHTITVCDCDNIHNHIDDYAGLKEGNQVGYDSYVDLDFCGLQYLCS
jgi:hypothetical protein